MKKSAFFDKAYLSRVVLYVSLTVIAVGVLFYIGYHMTGDTRGGIDTMYAVSEILPRTVSGNAYIIRDEAPIDESIGQGFLSPIVRDGDKVRIGSKVADVYTMSSATVSKKITLIEDQIEFYERCISTYAGVGDTSNAHRDITSSIVELRRRTASGNVSAADSAKPDLTLSIRRMGVLTGKVTDFHGQITYLEGEAARLSSSLGSSVGTVYAPSSGYYFSTTDGLEGLFSSSAIDSVTFSDVVEAMENASDVKPQSGSAGKIISNFKWYAACRMTSREASGFRINGTYPVYLKNNPDTLLDMRVHKILSNGKDSVVIFECTSIPDGYDFTRLQEFAAVYDEMKTYRIPVSAMRVHEGMEGVFILDEVVVKFRRVSVIDEQDGFFICSADDPDEVIEKENDSEAETEKNDAETEENAPYYAYLRENDIIITSGTGLYVGMTYNPSK